jgi:hypothetical protein
VRRGAVEELLEGVAGDHDPPAEPYVREVATRDELIRVGSGNAKQRRGLGDRVDERQFDRFTHR